MMRSAIESSGRARVLVVDDEHAIRFALRDYLESLGHQVDCASEREEAEALLSHVRYSAVIADLRLTDAHGAEGLELVSFAHERWPTTRFIILTAHGSPEIEEEARRRGAVAFLLKPMPLGQIAEIVANLLSTKP
jgi:DNA-binding NtrC family response regulator